MSFPNNNQFTPILVGGKVYEDVVKDINPSRTDIVGDENFPSFYYAYDTINVYFRMRVRADPRNRAKTSFQRNAWGVLLNTTGVAGTYDWMLAINGLKNRVNLIQNVDKEFNSWTDAAEGTNGKGEPNFSRQIINFDVARVVQADSTLGDSQNYFIDFLFPASTFFSYLDITPNDPIQMVAFTATNNNNYNKDSLRRSEDYEFKDALSDPTTVNTGNVKANLQISKTMLTGPTDPMAGQNYEWTGRITLTNIGKSQATILNVVDVVALDVVSVFEATSVSQGSTAYNEGNKTLTWTVGDLEAGESATLDFIENGLFYTSGDQVLNAATGIGFDLFTGGQLVPVRSAVTVDVQATGGVAGNVLNQVNGLPEENVTVRLMDGATEVATTQTDAFGDYNFTGVTPDTYTVEFSKADFTDVTRIVEITADNVTIVNLYIAPALGNLAGTVTSGGSPIDGAKVAVSNNIGQEILATTTDAAGEYTINNVQPGHYVLTVTADGYQSQSIGKDVNSNDTSVENFSLAPNPGTVEGTVTSGGSPIENATVDVIGSTGLVVASAITDAAGKCVINRLAPGSYRFRAKANSYQTFNVGFSVLAGQTADVDVNLLPNPGSVEGRVKDEDDEDDLEGCNIKITNSFGLTIANAITDANGRFNVGSLAPGNYVCTFASNGHGSKNFGFYVRPDLSTVLDCFLRRLTGVLEGTVESDGSPVSGAKIDVVSNNVVVAKTVANDDGTYKIRGLSPGRYTCIFTADGYSTTTLGALIRNNRTFELNAEVKQIFGSVTGRVTTDGGDPLVGAVLLVNNSDSDVLVSRRVTDSNGEYTVNELKPGSYSITASFTNYQSLLGGAIVTSGNVSELDFSLTADPSTIVGTIINEETGEPIKGESIQMQLIDSNGVLLATTFCTNEGEFTFENVLVNTYTVNANTDAYRSLYASVKTEPGQVTTTRVGLVPLPGFITGTLRDADTSVPIAGATINISNALGFQVDSLITSTDGEFLTVGLPAGIYTMAVVAEGYETNLIGEIVPWGFTKSIDIELKANPGSISGIVTPPAENLIVQLYSLDNQLVNATAADPTGAYQFENLAPGNYILKAAAPNYSVACTGASVKSNIVSNIPLTIKPNPGSISGNIVNDLGETLSNVTISLLDVNETPIAYGNTDVDGNYFISNVPPGSYALIAKLMMHTTTTGTVAVEAGQEVQDIDFVMARLLGTISGGVSDFQTGEVITGASVLLRNSLGILIKYTTSDQFGKFLYRNVGPDSYTVTCSAPNYSTEITGVIVPAGETSGANVRLKTTVGDIEGQVVDETGDPISGDNIQLKLLGANKELLQAFLANPDGSFVVPSLSEGTYFVTATLEGYTANLVSSIITAGEVNNVVIQLSPILATVSGTVLDANTGSPITGTAVFLSLTRSTGVFVSSLYPSENGVFTFDSVLPGSYLLNVNAEGYGNEVLTVTVPLDGIEVDISLKQNPGAVTGYVTNQLSSEPLNNAVVTVSNFGKTLESKVVTDSFGQFTFPNLSPGSYRAIVSAEEFSSQSATFEVLPDQTTSLSFILTPEPGDLIGTVTEVETGNPIPGVNIQVRYLTPTGPVYATTLTDENGIYRTEGLFAGTYTIIAFAESGYGSSSASVKVPANGSRTVDFELEPFPAIAEGTIRDETTGEPVANVFVRLLDIHGSSIQTVNSDRNGFYRFTNFTASQYLISAISPNYQRVQVSINPKPGETVVSDIFFTPEPGAISGIILDAETESPLVGAQVEVYSPGSTVPVARRTAGASGDFLITGVFPGSFTINAYTLNYSQEIKGIVVDANATTELEFRLVPDPVTISGTVVDDNGQPLANVSVRIIDEFEAEVGNGISDIDGNFSVGSLPSGAFTIIAGIDDYAEFTTGVSVLPGDEYSDLNVVMIPLGGTFTGRVVNAATSEAIPGVLISVSTPEGVPIISTNSETNGEFVSPLLSPGMYTVIASSPYFVQDQTGVIVVSNQTSEVLFSLEEVGGTIFGTVLGMDGDPILNTSIAIRVLNDNGALLQTLQALSEGTFEVLNLPSGSYRINVIADKYQASTVGAIVENGEISELTVPLVLAGGSIQGTITDTSGASLPGSFVELTDVNGILVATITSDQNGEFLFSDIKVGQLNVKATAPDYGVSSIGVIVEPAEISTVQLSLSQITGTITGVVTDTDGNPISNATVAVADATNTSVATVITNSDGTYTIPQLDPSEYTITASESSSGANVVSGTVIPGDESIVDITLIPLGAVVQGTILDIGGEVVVGATVELRSVSPFGPIVSTVLTDSDGNYDFGTISNGTYTIVVTATNYGSESGSVLIEAGVPTIQQFVLTPDPSSVEGVVTTDGVAAPNTVVKLLDITDTSIFEVQTDADGRYLIQNINPGIYTLLVNNPDYQSEKQGFTIGAGESTTVNFDLVPQPSEISGTVINNQTNFPVVGAIVQIFFGDSVQPSERAVTNAAGEYTVTGLAPGAYTILITSPNFDTFTAGATVRANEATTIDGFLTPDPGVVTGTVTGPEGAVAGAAVKVVAPNGSVIGSGVTDANGNCSIGNLPVGIYVVSCSAPLHENAKQGVDIEPGEVVSVSFELGSEPGSVDGIVTDENGNPQPGTVVNVISPDGTIVDSVVTDEEGFYTIQNLDPKTYQVIADKPGQPTTSVGAIVEPNDTVTTDVVIPQTFGTITGTITNADGDPLTNRTILINLFDQNDAFITSVQAQTNGTYTIPDVKEGTYFLTAITKGFSPGQFAVTVEADEVSTLNVPVSPQSGGLTVLVVDEITSTPVTGVVTSIKNETGIPLTSAVTDQEGKAVVEELDPGTVIVSAATPNYTNSSQGAIIEPGVTKEAVLSISPETGDLAGVITDPNGDPIAGATIQILDSKRSVITTVLTQSDGVYKVFDLALGIYTMLINSPGYEQQSLSADITSGETTATSMSLPPVPGKITGVVTDSATGAFLSRTNVELRLISSSGPVIASTLTDSQGKYTFADIESGSYTVVASSRFYGDDADSVTVEPGNTTFADLQLTVTEASVEGRVTGDGTEPLANTLVRISDQNKTVVAEVQTDADGNFQYQGLNPGEYNLAVINPDYRAKVVTFQAEPDTPTEVNNSLVPIPSTFTGIVTDADTGLPIVGAIVEVLDLLSRPVDVALTNIEGRYTVTGLSDETYALRASAQAYGSEGRQSTLFVNDTNVENFALGEVAASISGTVTSAPTGDPISEASLNVYDDEGVLVGNAFTEQDGTYRVGNLSAGTYTVAADAVDYLEARRNVTLATGEDRKGVNFELARGEDGAIVGRVSDNNTGVPIEDVLIQLYNEDGTLYRQVRSNEEGVYSLSGLPVGTYEIRATKAGYEPFFSTVRVIANQTVEFEIRLTSTTPVPPPVRGSYYITTSRGEFLQLDGGTVPTLFRMLEINESRGCGTFSYESVNGDTRIITLDLSSVTLSPVKE
ncbi:carboxypeptidase regulatory-like domain-containing protein [Guptibacillus algicola]|uniref:carboxypeptidase regulatory-like domain-containing protein n=1 Tax=Guptibacillus algicola TaxID=225844 RepID=UPI001CD816DA|nr:carboxypeptidase regulatory-like domain-containing protein [Alkalihalobacillus algicola]MCA0987197.1 carboxypeptidase regulatory-like domain-containing protein [Alkalihalobacillus algicola]